MATTIAALSAGQFPQTSRFESGMPNLTSLHRIESNGNATVGNNYSIVSGGTSYNHTQYMKFGTCFTTVIKPYQRVSAAPTPADSNLDFYYTPRSIVLTYRNNGSPVDGQTIFGCLSPGQKGARWIRTYNSGSVKVSLVNQEDTVAVDLYSNTNWVNIQDGKSHQIALVKAATNDWKLYIDGTLHDLSTTTVTFDVATGVALGANGDTIDSMTGQLDEIAGFNKALSAAEMYAYGGALMC
jgi:hypothetical protein